MDDDDLIDEREWPLVQERRAWLVLLRHPCRPLAGELALRTLADEIEREWFQPKKRGPKPSGASDCEHDLAAYETRKIVDRLHAERLKRNPKARRIDAEEDVARDLGISRRALQARMRLRITTKMKPISEK